RYYDLGYNEIVDANPGVDPWVPPVGTTIVLPTEWILPCCSYEGLVVNITEMRLYLYRRTPGDARTLIVDTLPVGLGRDDRRTPRGRFTVRGKTVNPTWIIPQSIRAEHIEETGDTRTKIPGGDPDNPLGKYRLELTLPRYDPRHQHPVGRRHAGEPRLRAPLPRGHRAPLPAGPDRHAGRIHLPGGQGRDARGR